MRWNFESHTHTGCCGPTRHRSEERHARGRGDFKPGHFGPGAGPFAGRRGGGAGRFFESGALRFVILSLIAEAPRHGYEIIKLIEERLGGAYAPSPGIVYPMLTMLEEMGQATVQVDGTRKLYAITEEGSRVLADNKDLVDAITERMKTAGAGQHAGRSPQIMRAVENLRMALRMKAGSLTEDQVHKVTDILDAGRQTDRARISRPAPTTPKAWLQPGLSPLRSQTTIVC